MGAGKAIAIAAFGILAVIVLAFIIVPSVNLPNSMNFTWAAYGMKEGQRVTPPFAFISQDKEIDAIGVEASWAAQGSDIQWNTLIIAGDFEIWLCDSRGTPKEDITPMRMDFLFTGEGAIEKTISFELACSSLLEGYSYSGFDYSSRQMYYWIIEIILDVNGQVEQTRSDLPVLQDNFSDSVQYTVYWSEAAFSLQGGIP